MGTCGPLMKVLKISFEQYYSVKVHLINEVGEGFLLQNREDDVAVACYFQGSQPVKLSECSDIG